MKVVHQNHSFVTTQCSEFVDLTEDVLELIERSGVANGIALIYSPHTTGLVVINEKETGFVSDFRELIERLVPVDSTYRHDDLALRSENLEAAHTSPNGHAHCRQTLIGSTSQSIPIVDGQLRLGPWQRVFFVECDRARDRHVLLQVLGD
jgi:secondary thiamine-phosphate synthase enzyme